MLYRCRIKRNSQPAYFDVCPLALYRPDTFSLGTCNRLRATGDSMEAHRAHRRPHHMTRLTAAIIQGDERVFASAFGPINGKYGLYVGTIDEAPSGWERPRDLLTSEPIYET